MFHLNSLSVDFKLPGGSKAKEKENFVSVDCNQCHTVYGTGVDEPWGQRCLSLPLAGETGIVRSSLLCAARIKVLRLELGQLLLIGRTG